MLNIKVWCLSKRPQKELERMFWDIVGTVESIEGMAIAGHTGPGNILVLFPKDMMKFGLGSEVLVEVEGLNATDDTCNAGFRRELAKKIGRVVQKHAPKAQVDCHVYPCHRVVGGVEEWQGPRKKMPAEKRPASLRK